jgi:hypothetical protein
MAFLTQRSVSPKHGERSLANLLPDIFHQVPYLPDKRTGDNFFEALEYIESRETLPILKKYQKELQAANTQSTQHHTPALPARVQNALRQSLDQARQSVNEDNSNAFHLLPRRKSVAVSYGRNSIDGGFRTQARRRQSSFQKGISEVAEVAHEIYLKRQNGHYRKKLQRVINRVFLLMRIFNAMNRKQILERNAWYKHYTRIHRWSSSTSSISLGEEAMKILEETERTDSAVVTYSLLLPLSA